MPSWLSGVWGLSSSAFITLISAVALICLASLVIFLFKRGPEDRLRLTLFAFLKLEVGPEIPKPRVEPVIDKPNEVPEQLDPSNIPKQLDPGSGN